ncbi:MAG: ATP-dependent helicase, partial [Jatrophihabitans sp.]|nr:ATP-dependent helicase [Jatrophihabitans sp.]
WTATGQEWVYDAERYAKVARVRQDEQQAMRDYLATPGCRMRFLREQLDDPEAVDCGRCDRCGGLTLAGVVDLGGVKAASNVLSRPGVPVDPRRMWPTAMPSLGINVKGKLRADELAEPGRVVARFTDLGLGQRVRSVVGPGAADEPVPDDLVRACVQVLASWGWADRPSAVVHVGSRRLPQLTASLAARLAEVGRLDDLGAVPHLGASSTGRSNSALRLRDVWPAYPLPPELDVEGRSVLLIDSVLDSGWTLAVVARQLRRAGARAVYPLALGLAG